MVVDRDENDMLRVQAQQAALFGLLKSGIPTAEPDAAWPALTEALATTLSIRRASVWLFNADRSEIRLAYEYDSTGNPRREVVHAAAGHPAYFGALLGNRSVVAPDARTDPRTVEFLSYFVRDDVHSLLDAGIWRAGEPSGVVCAETVGARHDWTTDEQLFAGSIADLAAAVLDHADLERARSQLEESQELFSRALRSSPDWISVVRLSDGIILEANEAFERGSGYRVADVVGRSTLELGLWADPGQRDVWIEQLRRDRLVQDFEVEFRKKSGELRTFLLSGHCVSIHGAECVVTISRDVTERRRHERLIQDIARGVSAEVGESFFRSLVEHLATLLDADLAFVGELVHSSVPGIHVTAAAGAGADSGDLDYVLEATPSKEVLEQGLVAYREGAAAVFPGDPFLAARGIEGYVGAALVDSHGKPLGILAVLFRRKLEDPDFTKDLLRIFATRASAELERQQNFRAVHHLAHHDSLTGLPNRLRMRQRLEADLAAIATNGKRGALILIDLDRFKEVNDRHGHAVGDEMLKAAAAAFTSAKRSEDILARIGGEEFLVVLPACESRDGALQAAERMREAVTRIAVRANGQELGITTSGGVAMYPDEGGDWDSLFTAADRRLYAAKSAGRNLVVAAEQAP